MSWSIVLGVLWSVFTAVWLFGAFHTKRNVHAQSSFVKWSHFAEVGLCFFLLFGNPLIPLNKLDSDLFHVPSLQGVGVAITGIAIGFAIWARVHLGALWSAEITIKETHTIVRTGPYAFVRHPIYTGLFFGFVGSLLTLQTWRALVALLFLALVGVRKIRSEEAILRQYFGAEYDEYAKSVKALIPGIF